MTHAARERSGAELVRTKKAIKESELAADRTAEREKRTRDTPAVLLAS
jgi:hypothetical protein